MYRFLKAVERQPYPGGGPPGPGGGPAPPITADSDGPRQGGPAPRCRRNNIVRLLLLL